MMIYRMRMRFSPLNRLLCLPQIKQSAIKQQNVHDEQTLRTNDTVVFEAVRNSQVYSKVTRGEKTNITAQRFEFMINKEQCFSQRSNLEKSSIDIQMIDRLLETMSQAQNSSYHGHVAYAHIDINRFRHLRNENGVALIRTYSSYRRQTNT